MPTAPRHHVKRGRSSACTCGPIGTSNRAVQDPRYWLIKDPRGNTSAHQRFIGYRLTPRSRQRVTFVEDGPTAGRLIGVAKGSRGRLRFRPADGKAESRGIYAVVEQDGFVRDRIKVATYRAPGALRPAKPRRLRVSRQGGALSVKWRRSPGARSYEITARLRDGRRLFFQTPRSKLRIRGVRRSVRGIVSVRGVSSAAMKGSAAHAGLRLVRR